MKKICTAFLLSASFLLTAVELDVSIRSLGGNVRGFGVLAKYGTGGPRKVVLTRRTSGNKLDKKPDFAGFSEIASFKVFDPDGREVVFQDLGNQKKGVTRYEITIPEGKAGVWRFSTANGLDKDQYTISFPDTGVWGVRGEMALTPGKKFPDKLYLYVPENAKLLIVESFGRRDWLNLKSNGRKTGNFKNQKRRNLLCVPATPESIVEGDFSRRGGTNALAVDGVPGLWCVSPEAARELAGGCVKVGKYYVCGPYQARARKKILSYTADELEVKLPERKPLPENISFPRREALLFGKYGTLESAEAAAKVQNTDKNSPFYGAMQIPPDHKKNGDWTCFLNHKSYGFTLTPGAIGNIVALPAKLNRAYHHTGLVKRACLTAFAMVSMRLSGDDIVRENDLRTNSYPHIHIFFAYDSLAKGGYLLRDLLDKEEKELWQEALLRIGDKSASCMGFESNQWAHMMTGHLHTYMFTGKKRFKGYFEVMMNSYLDGVFGINSKFGQHPAGYFLEEYGPDGNYDHLNMFSLVESLWQYRKFPDADPKLVQKMEKAIARNLEFKKYIWLPSPDGNIHFPNAFNCRTHGSLSNPSYPGDYLASFVNPLGYTRWMMIKMPQEGVGRADNFPHNATTDQWALRLINKAYSTPVKASSTYSGNWACLIDEILTHGVPEKKVALPYEKEFSLQKLPGFAVWNTGKIYGASFYDVAGSKKRLLGITSGGPLVLWTGNMGCVLASMRGAVPRGKDVQAKNPDQLTWSAVYGTDANGSFFHSGKEHSRLSGNDDDFTISGELEKGAGTLSWNYIPEKDKLTLQVSTEKCSLAELTLSLPFAVHDNRSFKLDNDTLVITDGGKYRFTVKFSGKAGLSGVLKTAGWCKVRALRIKFSKNTRVVFRAENIE